MTIVLVHGAFADASTWSGVSERLLPAGHHVILTANPLRGLIPDSAYLESFLNQISGPVLLVGHSYAGCVIGEAASRAKNVVGLVFVSAALAVSQRPLASAAATEKSTAAAWKTLPTWAVFGTADMCLGAEALGAMANRAKATTTELAEGSHLALLPQPAAVTEVILAALKGVQSA